MTQPTFYGKNDWKKTAAIVTFEVLFDVWTPLAIFCFPPPKLDFNSILELTNFKFCKTTCDCFHSGKCWYQKANEILPVFWFLFFNIFHLEILPFCYALIIGEIQQNQVYCSPILNVLFSTGNC